MKCNRNTAVSRLSRLRAGLAVIASAFIVAVACVPAAQAQNAAALRGRHAALREGLAHNAFGRPLVLHSTESSGQFRGEVFAVVAQPFGDVGTALQSMDQWCDVLMLHLNVKACRGQVSGAASTLETSAN